MVEHGPTPPHMGQMSGSPTFGGGRVRGSGRGGPGDGFRQGCSTCSTVARCLLHLKALATVLVLDVYDVGSCCLKTWSGACQCLGWTHANCQ